MYKAYLESHKKLPIHFALKARLSLASLQLHLGLFSFTCYLSDLLHTPVEIVFSMFMDAIIICPCFLVLPNGLTSIYDTACRRRIVVTLTLNRTICDSSFLIL